MKTADARTGRPFDPGIIDLALIALLEYSRNLLDQTDLASGRSWVAQLQEGLRKSDHLILVAAPEALASPRVEDEWDAFIAARCGWAHGLFHVVSLVDVPLPPFIDRIQRRDHLRGGRRTP